MGDADRRSVVRRTAEANDRMDAHAQVIESLMKVQTAHSAALTDHKNCIDTNSRGIKDGEAAWVQHDDKLNRHGGRLSRLEARAVNCGSFWSRVKWIFRGDSNLPPVH